MAASGLEQSTATQRWRPSPSPLSASATSSAAAPRQPQGQAAALGGVCCSCCRMASTSGAGAGGAGGAAADVDAHRGQDAIALSGDGRADRDTFAGDERDQRPQTSGRIGAGERLRCERTAAAPHPPGPRPVRERLSKACFSALVHAWRTSSVVLRRDGSAGWRCGGAAASCAGELSASATPARRPLQWPTGEAPLGRTGG